MKRISSLILLLTIFQIATANDEQVHESSHHEIPSVGLAIVFIFGGLLFSGILKSVLDRFNFSINPVLLLTGILLGNYYEHLGVIGKATKLMSELNPNGLLAIFLPALIFESAFKSEWYMLKKQFGQTLILGVPCVILASFLIMAAIKLFIYNEDDAFNWRQAFLLACTLCCTDMFSFVSKLKQYGTPQMLISLIEGESLFNYCTCVLIFQITNQIVIDYEDHSIIQIFPLLITQTFGGVVFGLIFGGIALYILKRISYNGILVVTIMVIFCYSVYMIMEFTVIKVSGIIALVTFGIFMGAFGKAHLIGQASMAMQTFWSYAVFIAESSIFLIAGVLVGVNVFEFEHIMQVKFSTLFYIYAIVLVARYISILTFQPRLSNLGYGMQWRQSLVIAYGGLKGAIGISFAIIVFQDTQYAQVTRNLFLMNVTVNSLLTLLINGNTTGIIINLLKLSNLTQIQYKFFKEYIRMFKDDVENKKNDMIGEKYLNTVDWEQINTKIGINQLNKLQDQIDHVIHNNNLRNTSRFQKQQMYYLQQTLHELANRNAQPTTQAYQQYDQQNLKFQIILQIRKKFIKILKYRYLNYKQQHNTMPDAVMLLLQSANVDLDSQNQSIQSWNWIKNQINYNIRFASELRKNYFIGSLARDYLFNYISYCYDVVSSYIQANQQARQQFSNIDFKQSSEAVKLLLRESEQNQKQAEDYLYNQLKPSFPEIQQEVLTRKASFNVLLNFRNIINNSNKYGQLEASQYQLLSTLVNRKKMALQLHNPSWKSPSFKQSLMEDKVFGVLPQKLLTVLDQKLSVFESYNSKQVIQGNSSISKHIYFIRRGGCSIEFINGNNTYKQNFKAGDIYGFESLLSSIQRSTITTNTLCTVVSVRKNYIERIMDFFPDFQQVFWKDNLFYLLKMYQSTIDAPDELLLRMDKVQLEKVLKDFKLKRVLEPCERQINEDCILLRGSCFLVGKENGQEQGDLEKVEPLTFFKEQDGETLKFTQKTSFLVGKFPTAAEENRNTLSVGSAASKKKPTYISKRSFQVPPKKQQTLKMSQK